MSQAASVATAAAGSPADCDETPIHAPGHIQPHGVLVATAGDGLTISHVSANFEESTGLLASDFLGGGLAALFGPAAFSAIPRMLDDAGQAPANARVLTLPLPFAPVRQVLAHRCHNRIFVELETPPGTEAAHALLRAPGVLTRLGEARGVAELCDMAARQIRGLTGFDRVMVHQFDEAGHRSVVAEAGRDGLPPFPHRRFPAADISPQVRRFYLRNRVRAIPDAGYRPVWLLSSEDAALDMGCCALSGVAPAHIEYLANLGVRAAASISIVRDDALWGMIFCHHARPMTISADLRALCHVIGQFMSITLGQAAEELRRTIMRTRLRHAEIDLARLAACDSLTGLANRRTIETDLKRWQLDGAPAEGALLLLDLDRFQVINDTLGHEAGDDCLVQAAGRLRQMAPRGSVAGRLGGDEFVLFWPGAAREEALQFAEACVAAFARPFPLQGRPFYQGVSVGVAWVEAAAFRNIMREADAAMFTAKRQGGGRAVLFEPALHDAVLTNMQTEQDLFRALEMRELEVHYQPIVHVAGRRLMGFEALARWRHPARGWISPSEFIPRAEEAGLIARLGAWVLDEAVRQLTAWRKQSARLRMSVNISSRQLKDGSLARQLKGLLADGRLAPEALILEVTESVLMEEEAVRELAALRERGFRIAVDDFGTGHSSLSYLHKLPVDSVKIDRSFVAPLGQNAKANRYFVAIVDLVRTLDLKAVAEGCETWEQWRVIEAAGCDKVQGWLVAPAMEEAAAAAFIAAPHIWR